MIKKKTAISAVTERFKEFERNHRQFDYELWADQLQIECFEGLVECL